ncbi:MAG TPA: secondary thiamine-phosphate synthase enzyme YjbQ [Opitutaceae bacterium]|nr:secondary thiamine-phosphate synthase enzyme YjbQ [Opitutaceae bacterium]
MAAHQATLTIRTSGRGLVEFTDAVAAEVRKSGIATGVVTIFCTHTSCSLVIMENADPSARADLEAWMDRLVPDGDTRFTHDAEGPDDMPAHIKMALTRTSETIPITGGRLRLGTWQGLYLWEHRSAPHNRAVVVTVIGM